MLRKFKLPDGGFTISKVAEEQQHRYLSMFSLRVLTPVALSEKLLTCHNLYNQAEGKGHSDHNQEHRKGCEKKCSNIEAIRVGWKKRGHVILENCCNGCEMVGMQ